MYCPQCHSANPAYNTECGSCGQKLPKKGLSSLDPGPLLGLSIFFATLAVVFLVFTVVNGVDSLTDFLETLARVLIPLGGASFFFYIRYKKLRRVQLTLAIMKHTDSSNA